MTMTIALVHSDYDPLHLAGVVDIMRRRGAPKIRCIWSESYSLWMAVEGCHRLRAAKHLGLMPIIIDVSKQRRVRCQLEDTNGRVSVRQFKADFGAWACLHSKHLTFDGLE